MTSNLGKEIEIIGGGTPKTTESSYWDGDIDWLSVVDFSGNSRWVGFAEKKITNEGLQNSSTKLLEPGDIIVSARGTVGEIAQLEKAMAFNQSCYGIRAKENLDQDFLYYLLKQKIRELQSQAHGGVFNTITRETFDRIKIQYPDKAKQEKIAKILGDLDRKIELNRRMNETLEQIGQALFKKYFVDNPDVESWRSGDLSEVTGINKSSIGKDFTSEYINYIDISSVGTGSLDSYQNIKLTEAPSRAKRVITAGDILWSTVRPNRRSFVRLGSPKANTVASTGFAVLSPKKSCSGFVYFHTTSQSFTDYLMRRAKGAAYPAVLASDFLNAPISIPPDTLLCEFESFSKPVLEMMDCLMTESVKLSEIRDLLLPKLISGEIKT